VKGRVQFLMRGAISDAVCNSDCEVHFLMLGACAQMNLLSAGRQDS